MLDVDLEGLQDIARRTGACRAAEEGAGHAAGIYCSIVQSYKVNQVNPLTYLTYLLNNVRNRFVTLSTPGASRH